MKKNGNQLMKFEEMQEEVMYAVTINPDDDYQCWNEHFTELRLTAFIDKTKNVLHKLTKDSCHLELYIETSPVGRLHYHGYITLYNKIDFYINCIHELLKHFHIEIDTLTEDNKWETYITKQQLLFNKCIKSPIERPIPIKIGVNFKKMKKEFFNAPK